MNKTKSTKRAFTLAEMMIVLLVLSLVTAAFLPIMTKRTNGSSDKIWAWANPATDAYFVHTAPMQGVAIGIDNFNGDKTRLLLNTAAIGDTHILFKQASNRAGILAVDDQDNIILGNTPNYQNIATHTGMISIGTPNAAATVISDGSVSIGNAAGTRGDNNTAIGSSATTIGPSSGIIENGLAIGATATVTSSGGIAMGLAAVTSGGFGIAIGGDSLASDTNSIAIGSLSGTVRTTASGANSTAIGSGSEASLANSIAIGSPSGTAHTTASGANSTAIGSGAIASIDNAIAIGQTATARTGTNNIAIGRNAESSGINSAGTDGGSIAIGSNVNANNTIARGRNSIAIGCTSTQVFTESSLAIFGLANLGSFNVAIGSSAAASGQDPVNGILGYSTAVGTSAKALSYKSSAFGYNAQANNGTSNTAIGDTAIASGRDPATGGTLGNSTAIGSGSTASAYRGTAIGSGSTARGSYGSTAIGNGASSFDYGSIAMGNGASSGQVGSSNPGSIAIGSITTDSGCTTATSAPTRYAIAIGNSAISKENCTIAIGQGALASGNVSTAIGPQANAISAYDLALGYNTQASGGSNIAIGNGARTYGATDSIAIGQNAIVYNFNSIAIGKGAYTNFPSNMVIGDAYTVGGQKISLVVSGFISSQDGLVHTSDRRLKNVGEEFNSGLDKIRELKTYNYTFKNDKKKTPRVGVMAQDLQKIFPDSIIKQPDGFLMVRDEDMFYAMVNSIKQLDTMIQGIVKDVKELALKVQQIDDKILALIKVDQANAKKIQQLEAKNKSLEARLARLEKLAK